LGSGGPKKNRLWDDLAALEGVFDRNSTHFGGFCSLFCRSFPPVFTGFGPVFRRRKYGTRVYPLQSCSGPAPVPLRTHSKHTLDPPQNASNLTWTRSSTTPNPLQTHACGPNIQPPTNCFGIWSQLKSGARIGQGQTGSDRIREGSVRTLSGSCLVGLGSFPFVRVGGTAKSCFEPALDPLQYHSGPASNPLWRK